MHECLCSVAVLVSVQKNVWPRHFAVHVVYGLFRSRISISSGGHPIWPELKVLSALGETQPAKNMNTRAACPGDFIAPLYTVLDAAYSTRVPLGLDSMDDQQVRTASKLLECENERLCSS